MKDLVKYAELFQMYKKLFTLKQQKYLNDYFLLDYSYAEIAQKYHVTAMTICDNITRCKKQLNDYENKLCLYHKHLKRVNIYSQIKNEALKKELLDLENN